MRTRYLSAYLSVFFISAMRLIPVAATAEPPLVPTSGLTSGLTSGAASGEVIVGTGDHRYRWVHDWIRLPAEVSLGGTHGCIMVDRQDRVYVNTEGAYAVLVFAPDGTLVDKWGQDYRGQAHGMFMSREPDGAEHLWLAQFGRHEVVRFSLGGVVEMTLPFPQSCPAYGSPDEYKPTSVTVAPNGDVYTADGYGKGWVHQYHAEGTWVRSWDGSAGASGKFDTPHGIGIDTRTDPPQVIVCDRGNHRLQRFTLDGTWLGTVDGFRHPCKVIFRDGAAVVPDLDGRVTILDRDWHVLAQLGDNPDVSQRANYGLAPATWRDGIFTAPHGAAWDSHGNLYVQDWNQTGRITKLERLR